MSPRLVLLLLIIIISSLLFFYLSHVTYNVSLNRSNTYRVYGLAAVDAHSVDVGD